MPPLVCSPRRSAPYTVSSMTQINLSEVERISGVSKRPRFALCTWLALIDLAGEAGQWTGDRNELAAHVEVLLPPGRYEARTAARAERIRDVRKSETEGHEALEATLATVPPGELRESLSRFHHRMLRNEVEGMIGHPLGQNISRTLTELKAMGLIDIEYIDPRGQAHTKPARGRTLAVYVHRR